MFVLNILLPTSISALVGACEMYSPDVGPQVQNRVGVHQGLKIVGESPGNCMGRGGTPPYPSCLYVMGGNHQNNAGCPSVPGRTHLALVSLPWSSEYTTPMEPPRMLVFRRMARVLVERPSSDCDMEQR